MSQIVRHLLFASVLVCHAAVTLCGPCLHARFPARRTSWGHPQNRIAPTTLLNPAAMAQIIAFSASLSRKGSYSRSSRPEFPFNRLPNWPYLFLRHLTPRRYSSLLARALLLWLPPPCRDRYAKFFLRPRSRAVTPCANSVVRASRIRPRPPGVAAEKTPGLGQAVRSSAP